MSLSAVAEAINRSSHDVLSTDLFDTVLLRDHTTETDRLATACRRAAPRLGVDAPALARLRWSFHDNAYRAVAMERPDGEASLAAICRTIAESLGLDEDAAEVLHRTEVEVDIEHLRPNRPLLELLDRATRSGTRVIALSDTYYNGTDLHRIIGAVIGAHPFAAVYSSADLRLTKHAGGIFAEVARRENVAAPRILHVGDNHGVDVQGARAASWTAVHLPRNGRYRATKLVGKVLSVPIRMRRDR